MQVIEKGKTLCFKERTFHRIHYEDMWSPYGKCQEIIRNEWRENCIWEGRKKWQENCIWEGANVVDLFKETAKKSMAKLLVGSLEVFREREKKI